MTDGCSVLSRDLGKGRANEWLLTKGALTKGCENTEGSLGTALPLRPPKGLKNVGGRAPCFHNPVSKEQLFKFTSMTVTSMRSSDSPMVSYSCYSLVVLLLSQRACERCCVCCSVHVQARGHARVLVLIFSLVETGPLVVCH